MRLDLVASFSAVRCTSCNTVAIPASWALSKPRHLTRHVSLVVVQSSAGDDSATSGDGSEQPSTPPATSGDGSEQPSTPPPPIRVGASPPVPPKLLDPLMASLTRVDAATANLPTRNIPIFGEVPADGSLVVLVPAAIMAVLGFALSIVVAFNSKDAIVATLSQVSDEISQTAVSRSSQMYDDGVCRGICSSQQQDLEGLKTFLSRFSKD
jgi:hypothetical protein